MVGTSSLETILFYAGFLAAILLDEAGKGN
jgi:hypothetical protein